MKKLLFLIIIPFWYLTSFSQQNEIEVNYNYCHINPTGIFTCSEMTLITNNQFSKFYNKINEKVDSMLSTIEGRVAYSQMMQSAMSNNDFSSLPIKQEPLYVLKSRNDSISSVFDLIGTDYWFYQEPLLPQNWEITDTSDNILGYDCFLATCNYRGRTWKAWFTLEIPIPDGPWKLNGLPGLILKAEDNTGQYSFIGEGIRLTSKNINHIYGKENYEKTDRIKFLQNMRAFINNPLENLKASIGAEIQNIPKVVIDESYDLLETDYHK